MLTSRLAGAWGYSVADQILPKLPGKQRPTSSVARSDTFENVLVFNYDHIAAAGAEKVHNI